MSKFKVTYVYKVEMEFGNTQEFPFKSHQQWENWAYENNMVGNFHKAIITV